MMKRLIALSIAFLLLASVGDCASIRLPLGNGRCVKVKGHRRALRNGQFSACNTRNGYGSGFAGARAR